MLKLIISLFLLLEFSYAESYQPINQDFTKKSKKALDGIVKEEIQKMHILTNSTNSANEENLKGYVLSSHIRTFSDIDSSINYEVDSIKDKIKRIIIRVASEIEVNNETSGKLSIDINGNLHYHNDKELPKNINDKKEKLLKANLQNSVSVRSLELSVRLLANINSELIKQGKRAKTRKEKEKIYLKQAIYVYEMSDILLGIINEITLEGSSVIYSIYNKTKNKVDNRVMQIDKKKKKVDILVEKGSISQSAGVKEKESLVLMQQANERSLEVWDDILKKIGNQKKFLNHLKTQEELIEYKRDKARLQLETLRDIKVIGEVKDTIGSLDKLVDSVSKLELLVLDKHTVEQLLGISE